MELKKITKDQIKLIQVARRKIGMSDDDFDALKASFGVDSLTKLNQEQAKQMVEHLAKSGFRQADGKYGKFRNAPINKRGLIGKIKLLVLKIGKDFKYADGVAFRMFRVSQFQFCTLPQLWKVFDALDQYAEGK